MGRIARIAIVALALVLVGTPVAGMGEAGAAERVKVSMIQSFQAMSFASIYVARAQNFFEQEGVDLDLQIVRGDVVAAQALVGRTAPMAALGGTEATTFWSRGIKDFIAVVPVISAVTTSVAVRKDLVEARGLSRSLPIAKRIAALKGLRIATASPGGAVYTVVSYLLRREGIDPKTDATLISMGGPVEMLAALKARQIDAIAMSPPAPETAEAEGAGTVLVAVAKGDVPELANIPYDILLVSRDYAAKNGEAVRRVVRAIVRASAFIRENPAGTRDSLQKYFDKVPLEVLTEVAKSLQTAVNPDARFTEEMWKNQMIFDVKAAKIKEPLDTREGVLWTNEYNARK
ncbi:MAG: ABC transporter substrate-binding protein [Candidatus Rokubacteria bacterium]|nr:ABC transporter substrate-binding protein [Candidatus Rokubacteria bacterium]MBI2494102.1 ABC transporter substrate-binding protein [Candidatus Rokubacteria bacterium]MBI4255408.1 ABC transporter substrate-binding protein [Candidatus Rokubacteria bacterium]